MAFKLPPSPVGQPPGNSFWNDWYEKLRTLVNGSEAALAAVQAQVTGIKSAEVITSSASSAFDNERVLTAGDNVTIDVGTPNQIILDVSLDQDVVTFSTEATIPNSRVLTAGSNITLDTTTPGQLIVSSSGGGGGGGGDANITPDTHPTIPNPADDEFEYGTSVDTTGTRFSGATPWTWVNQGTATGVVAAGALVLSVPASSTANARTIFQPAAAGDWKYRINLLDQNSNAGSTNIFSAGLIVRNSANGRMFSFSRSYSTGMKWLVQRWASSTAVNATVYSSDGFSAPFFRSSHIPTYFEVEKLGTSVIFRISDSGVAGTFYTIATEPLATYLLAVDQVGIYVDTTNNNVSMGVFDWFRKIT